MGPMYSIYSNPELTLVNSSDIMAVRRTECRINVFVFTSYGNVSRIAEVYCVLVVIVVNANPACMQRQMPKGMRNSTRFM